MIDLLVGRTVWVKRPEDRKEWPGCFLGFGINTVPLRPNGFSPVSGVYTEAIVSNDGGDLIMVPLTAVRFDTPFHRWSGADGEF